MTRWWIAGAAVVLMLFAAPAARAEFGLVPDSFQVTTLDATGQPETRAGAHPDRLVTSFAFNTVDGDADGNAKDMVIDLPPGLIGDTRAVPLCPRPLFAQGRCGAESQIGVVQATFPGFGPLTAPIYAVVPSDGEFAEFGFFAFFAPVRLVAAVRADSDFGMEIAIRDLFQNLPMTDAQVEFWGVPADHQSGTAIPRLPFLTNPTSCDTGPPVTALRVRSWQQPEHWIVATAAASGALAGCERLAFDPALGIELDSPSADTPSGLSVELTLPQDDDPDGLATSHARGVGFTLPAGLTLSPGVANGLAACDDEQLGIGTTRTPSCPPSSKIGTVELTTPLLTDALDGEIFFGRRLPADRYRLFVAASGQGMQLKLRGSLLPDPETGQLFMTLTGLPAFPFNHLSLHFKDGPRAPVATPPSCGADASTASVSAYRGGAPTQVAAPIEIVRGPSGSRCATVAPFAPQLVAGTSPAVAGAGSSLSVTVRRADGDQTLERLSVTLPPGVAAHLASVPRCAAAAALAAACPPASRVGSAAVEAGAGSNPLPLTGDVYLTGPYRDAPFGFALVLRAQAGPLDLGTVVVPATVRLDPADAHITVTTDALPTVIAGVPLRLRTLALDIDRPGFVLNPTSCAPTRISASMQSLAAATASSSSRYAIGSCRRLAFAPRVSMSLGAQEELRRGGHPSLTIALRPRPGQAAVRSARIELPRMVTLDAAAVTAICPRARARRGACPNGSRVGSARVRTPLLPHALTGPVVVVQPSAGTRPDLWATMAGMGMRLNLRSTTSARHDGPISTSFVGLPDIPLSAFSMRLGGSAHPVLSLATSLCRDGRARPIAVQATLRGQNGGLRTMRVHVRARHSCSR